MSPTKVAKVELDDKVKKARVLVPEDQLSIAIGKSGQNVRLASKLAGYEIDIEAEKMLPENESAEAVEITKPVVQRLKKKSELENGLLDAIEEHGE